MVHRSEVPPRPIAQPYIVEYVNTFASCAGWAHPQRPFPPYGLSKLLKHKRVAVVYIPHTIDPVTIPFKDFARDPKVDSHLQPTLFLLPDYTQQKRVQYMDDYLPMEPNNKEWFGLESQCMLMIRTDSLGHTVTTGYAEVSAAPFDFGLVVACIQVVKGSSDVCVCFHFQDGTLELTVKTGGGGVGVRITISMTIPGSILNVPLMCVPNYTL